MLRYLKAAFFASPTLPLLGTLPLNVLFMVGVGILGFVEPAVWFVGLGVETAYLFALGTNQRFQHVIDARHYENMTDQSQAKRQNLIAQLQAEDRVRLAKLEQKNARILELSRNLQSEDFTTETNHSALQKLSWLYLKLLIARHYLRGQDSLTDERTIREQVRDLQGDLKDSSITPSARDSKAATLGILQKRLDNLTRRQQTLEEVESDLTRIEAQIDLAMENVVMKGEPRLVSGSIELASHLLDADAFGPSGPTIADLDSTYAPAKIEKSAQ